VPVTGALADSRSSSPTRKPERRLDWTANTVATRTARRPIYANCWRCSTPSTSTALRVHLRALDLPHRPGSDPRDDLDLAGYGIVKVFDDRRGNTYLEMRWEPKAALATVGEYYRDH
jgi:hypothetical protein